MWAQDPEPVYVAQIGEQKYETLQAAIDAATDGQAVTLIADIEETATYTINKAVTIDFGTYTISASHTTSNASSNADKVFDITADGNLTVIGSTGGVTDATVLGIFNNAGTLTINGGHYTTTTDDYGVVYNNGGTCTIAGGELRGAWAAVYNRTGSVTVNGGTLYGAARGINAKTETIVNITNGNISSGEIGVFGEASSRITMSNGTVNATATSIYLDGAGAVAAISGGTINAAWGVQLYAGTSLSFTGGRVTATANGVDMKGAGTTATISGGEITAANGVLITDNAKLTVETGASITGTNTAISGNGSEGKGNTTIIINGGTITTGDNAKGVGIYHPQIGGTLTIAGGEITGNTAVEVRSGTLNITGGTLTANAEEYTCNANGDGSTTTGAALAIAQHTTQQNINVTISDGIFTGIKAINEANPEGNPSPQTQIGISVIAGNFTGEISTVDVEHFIEGGTYSEAFPAEYCVAGKAPLVDADGHCTIITPAESTADAEALSNDTYYIVLGKAIEAATEATTITLLKDPIADAIIIAESKDITLTVADGVTLKKPITNSGTLTISSGTISGAVTIADVYATVKIASEVNSTSVVALDDALKTNNVLKSNTTRNSGYTTYWVEKKVEAKVDEGITDETQKEAAQTLAGNPSISAITLPDNQSLTITVTSVTLTGSKVTNAVFDVKLIGADGQEIIGVVDPAVTFRLPIPSGTEENAWANLWHSTTALTGATVLGSDNKYVAITATTFGTFSYEIIAIPIAEIGVTKFGTMADAIKEADAESEIKLLADVSEDISVGDAKNITLTIGTHTISGNINNAGTLVISENTGTINGAVANTGTLTVEGGTVSGAVTETAGLLTISGGIFSNTITTSGTAGLNISKGTINGALTIGGTGTNTISDGTIAGAVTTSAPTAISGGEISGNISNTAALTITGGTFTGTIANSNPGTVAISGGTHTQLPVAGFCATGYMPIKNDAEKYTMTNEWAITDATDINASNFSHLTKSNDYSVATATYYRNTGMVSAGNTDTRYGTICLPFEIKAKPDGVKVLYKATSISVDQAANTGTLTITEVSYPVTAGTPLIFELSAEASNMTVTSTDGGGIAVNTTAPATSPVTTPEESKNLLVGTFTGTVLNSSSSPALSDNIYYLNGDKFHQAKVSLTVPAFRAYLDTTSAPSSAPSVLSIAKEGEDDATGISAVEALETVTDVYDLNGRKQNGLQRGINILRRADGTTIKVIVK